MLLHVTQHNARRNEVEHVIRPLHGSLAEVDGAYDLVVANILAHIIIDMAKSGLAARVKPGGTLVVSGILGEQADEVTAVLGQQGLRVTERRQQDEWVALVARKAFGSAAKFVEQTTGLAKMWRGQRPSTALGELSPKQNAVHEGRR